MSLTATFLNFVNQYRLSATTKIQSKSNKKTATTHPLQEPGPDLGPLRVQGDGEGGVHSVLSLLVSSATPLQQNLKKGSFTK